MAIFKRIIVPLDGSPLAEVAMPYAEELAAKLGSDIILLTVLPSGESEEFQNHTKYADKIVDIKFARIYLMAMYVVYSHNSSMSS